MAGSKLAQMTDIDIGEELIRRGWYQGKLIPATSARKSWLTLNTAENLLDQEYYQSGTFAVPGTWHLQQVLLDEKDFLIIISQTCDIQKPLKHEPYIEIMRAYWTTESSIIYEAGKNSVRRFLVRRRLTSDGKEEGLIVDATTHITLDKKSLLQCTPLDGFRSDDMITPDRFKQWLAKRYDRPALANELVNAVQKPIVRAIGRLKGTDDLHRILSGISEILFLPHNDTVPYYIDMLFMRDERNDAPTISYEDVAILGAWISDVLKRGGNAVLEKWEIYSAREITLDQYNNAYELPTDQFSLVQNESDE